MKKNLQYGIELELVAELPSIISKHLNINGKIRGFASLVNSYLKRYNIHINFCPDKNITDYSKWTLLKDDSLTFDGKFFAFELVSPIIKNNRKIKELQIILNILKNYNLRVNRSCSYHLHISKKEIDYSLNTAKNISKAFLLFEGALDFINPDRLHNNFCNSNRNSKYFKNKTLRHCYSKIDECKTFEQLVKLVNPIDKSLPMFHERGKGIDYGDYYRFQRFYKLNLTNLLNNKKTIEIRTHSGTFDIDKIKKWIYIWENIINWSEDDEIMKNLSSFDQSSNLDSRVKLFAGFFY